MSCPLAVFLALALLPLCRAEAHDSPTRHVVLFMFFGVGIAVVFIQALSCLKDPVHYTVCVFLIGVLLSLADNSSGAFGSSLSIWLEADAELLLYVFVPPLIFTEAMHLNWYQARRAMLQASVLAGPGVFLGTALTGCLMKAIQPQWSWYLALTFGSITAATDTVAVTALLKSAGASPKLTMITVGESLLNDGTAMVLFNIFFGCLNGESFTVAEVVTFIVEAFLCSCLLGVGIGYLAVRWLRCFQQPLDDTDTLMQIAITVCTAYASFYITQSTLKLSGVLACCGAGVILSWLAPPYIINKEAMRVVWHAVEWMLNTTIFLLAGLLIGNRAFKHVRAADWGLLVALYLVLLLVRAAVVAACYPVISSVGYKCSPREAVFLGWGGLRGAVSLALAMVVYHRGPASMEQHTSRLLFYVGGTSALSVMLNGTTLRYALTKLGLADAKQAETEIIQSSVLRKLQNQLCRDLVEVAARYKLGQHDLEDVCECVSLLNGVDVRRVMTDAMQRRSTGTSSTGFGVDRAEADVEHPTAYCGSEGRCSSPGRCEACSNPMQLRTDSSDVSFCQPVATKKAGGTYSVPSGSEASAGLELLEAGRGRHASLSTVDMSVSEEESPHPSLHASLLERLRTAFLSMLKVQYWQDLENGKLPRESKCGQFLLYSVEVALDEVDSATDGARDWLCVKEKLERPNYKLLFLSWLERRLPSVWRSGLTQYLGLQAYKHEERAVYMLSSFIAAHEHAQRRIHGYLCAKATDTERGDSYEQSAEEVLVLAESRRAVTCARRMLEGVNPAIVAALRVKQAALLLLNQLSEALNSMLREGLLTVHETETAMAMLSRDLQRVHQWQGRMTVEARHSGEVEKQDWISAHRPARAVTPADV